MVCIHSETYLKNNIGAQGSADDPGDRYILSGFYLCHLLRNLVICIRRSTNQNKNIVRNVNITFMDTKNQLLDIFVLENQAGILHGNRSASPLPCTHVKNRFRNGNSTSLRDFCEARFG